MTIPFDLVAKPPKQLTAREECALLERALELRNNSTIRLRLAELQNRLDDFDKTIALFDSAGPVADFATAKALVAAHLGRGSPEDLVLALASAKTAEMLADCNIGRAEALACQASVWHRTGDSDQMVQVAAAALELNPDNSDALRLIGGHWLATHQPEQTLALCDEVAAKGTAHSQLLGIHTQALAQRGDIDAARELAGLEHWLFQSFPPAPNGWADLPSFHAALRHELLECSALRNGRHGTASIASLRIDEPATATTPAMRALQQLIIDHVRAVVDELPSTAHPWLRMRPQRAHLQMWCVITGAEGYERWHMHPTGWVSGGYYVAVPAAVQHGNGTAGCLEFGLPHRPIGHEAAAAFGSRLVRPSAGLLNLFPSHAYHRTHPHGADDQRICVAYDVIPD
ncbi:MAG: hypothetical protein HC774_05835 [Sphingomonadales bacterium]|nr:hypothetical protein [Sphingomonadales bacterium]